MYFTQRGKITEQIADLNLDGATCILYHTDVNVVVIIGGDGTFNGCINGFLSRVDRAKVAEIKFAFFPGGKSVLMGSEFRLWERFL